MGISSSLSASGWKWFYRRLFDHGGDGMQRIALEPIVNKKKCFALRARANSFAQQHCAGRPSIRNGIFDGVVRREKVD